VAVLPHRCICRSTTAIRRVQPRCLVREVMDEAPLERPVYPKVARRLRAKLTLLQQDSVILSIPIVDAPDRLRKAVSVPRCEPGGAVGSHSYTTEDDLDRLLDARGANGNRCCLLAGACTWVAVLTTSHGSSAILDKPIGLTKE
jgi:hypothetical protein